MLEFFIVLLPPLDFFWNVPISHGALRPRRAHSGLDGAHSGLDGRTPGRSRAHSGPDGAHSGLHGRTPGALRPAEFAYFHKVHYSSCLRKAADPFIYDVLDPILESKIGC